MERYNLIPQGLSAEMIADQWEIPRSELDELALRSHRLAHRATEEGRFEREIIPFEVNGSTYVVDQGIRPGTTIEALSPAQACVQATRARSPPATSSQISDAAAAVLLMPREKADELRTEAARADRGPDDGRGRPGDHADGPDSGRRGRSSSATG